MPRNAKREMSDEIVIDAFKAGKYPQGEFGAKELSEIASTYNPKNYEAPILIGHISDPAYQGKSSIPAYGWIGKIKKVGDHLKFIASEFSDELKGFISKGFYKKVSAAFYEPTDPNNPTPGKWHLHHLAFLGGVPPAVKGLEGIAFFEVGLGGVEFAEMEAAVTAGGSPIAKVEELGTKDTLDSIAESCATFYKKAEEALTSDADAQTKKDRLNLAAYDLQSEINQSLGCHWTFIEKIGNIEEPAANEYAEKKTVKERLIELAQRLFSNNEKEGDSDVTDADKKVYTDRIAELEGQVTTLTAQVKQFTDAKAADDAAKAKAEKEAKETALKAEIKTFCDQKVKDGIMTPAMREKDELLMVTLGTTDPAALKSFQEKYLAPVIPTGKLPDDQPPAPVVGTNKRIADAEKYVREHPSEFAESMTPKQRVAKALTMESNHQIKFS